MPSLFRCVALSFVLHAFSPIALATPLSNPLPLSMPRYTSPSYYYIPHYTNESDITLALPISLSFPSIFRVSPSLVERDDVVPYDQRAQVLVQTFSTPERFVRYKSDMIQRDSQQNVDPWPT